ncbi:hypothetical protein K490DRAFT_31952 [Saccharata proteae CBS 121410]|uniref:Uncharacterized protein n=1 Tax=Saccharata proteae CBS 121410 TaxID=1314787 RepID=A0A9P4I232_9PEZI|nr:hypothetical protein K490DRAFT_31952 [Saccharata proteae CBS 121410]
MADSTPLNRLLAVLRERRIPLTRDDVQWAFESVKTQGDAEAWVQQYLEPETLISKEELEIYQQLSERRSNKKGSKAPPDGRPLRDDDFRTAIEALENSTAAIELQSRALEVQKDALIALKKQNNGANEKVQRREEDRRRRSAKEKAELDFAVEGLVDAVDERVTYAQKRTKATLTALNSTATERLTSDDRTLAALNTMAPKLEATPNSEVDMKMVEDWCSSITSFRAASIRARVDRIFQENLSPVRSEPDDQEAEDSSVEEAGTEKEALKEELEVLHSEIASVTEMVVEHEARGPIRRLLKESEDREKDQQRRWLVYILSSLDYMTTRLDTIATHAKDFGSYQTVLDELVSIFKQEKKELADFAAPSPKPSHSRARSKAKALEDIEYSTATKQILRHLDTATPGGTLAQAKSGLAKSAIDSEVRLFEHLNGSRVAAIQDLASSIGGSDSDLQSILEALYANTEYKDVHLVNQPLDRRLRRLDGSIAEISKTMVDLNSMMDPAVGTKRDVLLENWGGS